ncbi:radical SAM family protein [Cereibacter ovatus]|uniref:Radical SAM family protein n=1 Tax=Cereibacter ovatus TaxID=439529 RepID=A0A285CU09_9RHOB|nr:radical SAM protein [Cereibacter ovatus]SNX71060.1 radical SAM family protein [Cereibacter ovatus]
MTIQSGRGTAADLWRLQSLAAQSLVVSVTRKCPLRCGHCITRSGPAAPGPLLSPALAAVWAGDLPAMAAQGLRHLTLTGGEPILARDACRLLAGAGAAAGVSVFVVTSGVWARSAAQARAVVAGMAGVARWDLGVDGWHAQEMPLERIGHALDAILAAGGTVTLRLCEGRTAAETRRIETEVAALVRGRAPMIRQSVRRIGRAADRGGAGGQAGLPRRPCVSTGLFLRADGSTGPCCSGLAYEAPGHPFTYGRVLAPGDLRAAWQAWQDDPLLRLMRVASLAGLNGWLAPDRRADLPADPCEACVALWSRLPADEAAGLRERAAAVTDRLALLEARLHLALADQDADGNSTITD